MTGQLWLDDERPAPEGWRHARTSQEAIEMLSSADFSVVSLDHDLGEDGGTGYDVLLWIEAKVFEDERFTPPEIRIHTANISARTKMELGVAAIRKRLLRRGRLHPGDAQTEDPHIDAAVSSPPAKEPGPEGDDHA